MKRVLAPLLAFGIPVALVLFLAGGPSGAAVGIIITAAVVIPASLLRSRPRSRRRR